MAEISVFKKFRVIVLFLIARYPFANAISLLLLLAERATREEFPPIEPKVIYAHLGVFILCGVGMGFNLKRKEAATVHAGQLLFLAYHFYMNKQLKYQEWVRIRMSHRMVGIAGFFLLYAFFTSPKPRSQSLRRFGEIFVGLYLVCATYLVVESGEDRQAFVRHVPGGEGALYVFVILSAACALCYLPGYYVHDISQALVVMLLLTTSLVECRLHYWTRRRGMDYWNQIRMLMDNICLTLGVSMYLLCTKRKSYVKEE